MARNDAFSVPADRAQDPLVFALDIGSTASRGGAFDATGRPVGRRVKVAHAFTTASDGTSQIDPDQICAEVAGLLDALVAAPDVRGRVAAVGLDTFASSLVGVDAAGRAVTPCYTYADSRCGAQVTVLRARLDEAEVQQRTGARLHSSYLAPRLLWLRESDPSLVRQVVRWLSLGEFVQQRLLGATVAGTPTASWTGLLNRHTGSWDSTLLDVCGVGVDQLSPVQDPGIAIEGVDRSLVASRWPMLRDALWMPVVADGLSSNLGTGAADPLTIGAAAATSGAMRVLLPGIPERIPPGLWCYRIDARRSLLGGAINDVGRLVAWLRATLRLPDDDAELDAILARDPVAGYPSVVPFLTGERSTGWAANARAVIAGLSGATTPEAIFRASAEAVALSYARVGEQLTAVGGRAGRIVASGRITQAVPHLLQLLADAMGTPVEHVAIRRATLRGTALLALETVAPDIARADPPIAGSYHPRAERAAHYAQARARFDDLYAVSTGSPIGPPAGASPTGAPPATAGSGAASTRLATSAR